MIESQEVQVFSLFFCDIGGFKVGLNLELIFLNLDLNSHISEKVKSIEIDRCNFQKLNLDLILKTYLTKNFGFQKVQK